VTPASAVHRGWDLAADTTRHRGIPVTSPLRTAAGLTALLRFAHAQIKWERLYVRRVLAAAARRLGT
jgi:hypothetical protein